MFKAIVSLTSLTAITVLLANQSAADRGSAVVKAKEILASETATIKAQDKLAFTLDLDWKTIPESEADRWATTCTYSLGKVTGLCSSEFKRNEACTAYINAEIKSFRCSLLPEGSLPHFGRTGSTLTFAMSTAYDSSAPQYYPEQLDKALPGVRPIMVQHVADTYFAKRLSNKNPKLTVDAKSFIEAEFSMTGIATYCAPAWDFLRMMNHPECQLKGCKGDYAKKQKFLEGATQLRCIHSKEPKAPQKVGDTIQFFTGKWASKTESSLTGIPSMAFLQLRSTLKLRDCGVDDEFLDDGHIKETCCPKGANGKCLDVGWENRREEVCTRVGFSTEKTCHPRRVMDKSDLAKAR